MALSIILHVGSLPHHKRWCDAFAAGLKRHGLEPLFFPADRPQPCDLAVFWSHRFINVIEAQKQAGRDYLVLENAYLGARTTKWASAGYNGLNGYADFLNRGMTGERWQRHFGELMEPWRTGGEYIAVMGQVPGDQSLRGLDIYAWAADIAEAIKAASKMPVYFCPHPFSHEAPPAGMPWLRSRQEAFRHAYAVVTYNSNSAVDALLAGIPAMVCDRGGMAWDMACHAPGEAFIKPDRQQWAHNLAWCQWTEDEFRSGEAWEHLRKKYAQ